MPEMRTAALSHAQTTRLLALERELGVRLIALQPVRQLAKLGEEEMQRLAAWERELGVVFVAHRSGSTLSELSDGGVTDVRRLERQLGCVLLAYEDSTEPRAYRWPLRSGDRQLATLSVEQLNALQQAERELQIVALAYDT